MSSTPSTGLRIKVADAEVVPIKAVEERIRRPAVNFCSTFFVFGGLTGGFEDI